MQGGFRLRPKCQHLQSRVELTQLLLQAGCQGVVGHVGKVQKREEVLGANHAKALGEVGVHQEQPIQVRDGKGRRDLMPSTGSMIPSHTFSPSARLVKPA